MALLQAVAGEAALDVVAFETVPCLKELRVISRLMRTEFPGTPAWVACSCKDAGHIAHGESLAGILPHFPVLAFYAQPQWSYHSKLCNEMSRHKPPTEEYLQSPVAKQPCVSLLGDARIFACLQRSAFQHSWRLTTSQHSASIACRLLLLHQLCR